MLPCSCELLKRYQLYILLKLEGVHIFWRPLEIHGISGIGGQQSTQESYGVAPSYPKYLTSCYPVKSRRSGFGCSPTVFTKGRRKTDSTKRGKSNWEHIQIFHVRIEKSSKSGSGSVPDQSLVRVFMEEEGSHVHLGVEVEAIVGERARAAQFCHFIQRQTTSKTQFIGHLANSKHFIALHMKNNFPLPPIYEQ
ncbi:hypothetical protein M9H77_32193 [Catharanthus roseus]|uniref:Uncharacterized protein n=1 Tax=Catharanthus roseus TaxID=4058 RepID=A0ACC0A644_CATRO|nr:hypothetical protein M9H77_32193 [Catharanthus roseus]